MKVTIIRGDGTREFVLGSLEMDQTIEDSAALTPDLEEVREITEQLRETNLCQSGTYSSS
jgi:hypothetical protein